MNGRLSNLIELNGLWDFAYSHDISEKNSPAVPSAEEFEVQMPVPGYWDEEIERLKSASFWSKVRFNPDYKPIEFPMKGEWLPDSSLPFIVGVGWYKKHFEISEDNVDDKLITLCIGGVRLEIWVWLNGKLVGYHFGHSTPFEISLPSELINVGRNELIMAVANVRRDRIGFDLRGYQGYMGGIHRPIYLKINRKVRLADLYLFPSENNTLINWTAELQGNVNGKEVSLEWAVKELQSNKCLRRGTVDVSGNVVRWQTDNCDMENWSDENPVLYDIELQLREGDVLLDGVTQKFGLRTIERRETSLFLNGEPVFLRGVTDHCYFPLTCRIPSDKESYRAIIIKLKELGFNWIRCHTWIPSEEYMEAADELGMMFQVEPPVGFGREEWLDIMRTCRKHPSVIIYCCGNEELLDESKIDQLRVFSELHKQTVPDALFNPQEALRGIEYVWTPSDLGDEISEKPFRHNPSRLQAIREFSDVFGHYSWGYLSYISSKANWKALTERMAIYQRPCLAHEIGIQGSYLDVTLEKRYENTLIGTDLFSKARKYLGEKGLLDKASVYYKNSCAWQRLLRKHCIEMARKCRYLAGYDFLGSIDHNNHQSGYTAGIMNEFYELKPGNIAGEIRQYNNKNVLLLNHSNCRSFFVGEHCRFDVMACLFGSEKLSAGTVEWRLADSDNVLCSGSFSVENVRNGTVETIGEIDFIVPPIQRAVQVKLLVRLRSCEYELNNDWDFWIFPKGTEHNIYQKLKENKELYENELYITSSITESAMKCLEDGKRVLLLGSGFFPVLPVSFQIGLPGRTGGNLATVIYKHPITEQFPHEGFCDWQFYSMLENSQAVVFDDLDIPFDPIIEVASSFKLIYKQASLFEFSVGSGKLLVCTLNLSGEDAATKYFSSQILHYAQSDDFKPCNKIECEDLIRIRNTKFGPYGVANTDMAYDPNAQL